MIIRNLKVTAFGKLKDRNIELSDGLNVIHGTNEAGKSTLHSFVRGMFFGFFRPYTKNRQYTPDLEKFRPWNSSEYGGSLTYEKDGKNYTITRNFSRTNESAVLYDGSTGEDITSSLDFDPVTKLFRVDRDLGVNSVLFDNTVSIPQMKSATGEELAKEMGELLVRAESARSSDISCMKALEKLRKQKDAIGTERQSRSKLGSTVLKLSELQSEYDRALKVKSETEASWADIKAMEDELASLGVREQNIVDAIESSEAKETVDRYSEYMLLKSDMEEDRKLLSTEITVSEEDYERYLRYSENVSDAVKTQEECSASLRKAEKALEVLTARDEKLTGVMERGTDSLGSDRLLYAGIKERLAKVKAFNRTEREAALKRKTDELKKMKRILLAVFVSLLVIGAALAVLSLTEVLPKDVLVYAVIAAGLGIIASLVFASYAVKLKKLEPKSIKFNTMMQKSIAAEIACTAQLDALCDKYGVKDHAALDGIFSKADELSEAYNDNRKKKDRVEAGVAALRSQLSSASAKEKHYRGLIRTILEEAGAEDEETLRRMMDISRRLDAIKERLSERVLRSEKLLDGDTEESLAEKAREAALAASKAKDTDTALLNMKLSEIRARKTEIASDTARLTGIIAASESGCRSLNIISEEIAACERDAQRYRKLLAAYTLAEETILKISSEIRGDFSGVFNSYISEIASQITGGKYTQVRTDEAMNVSVWDSECGRWASICDLSGATVDQLYFAVRFAIAELLIEDRTVPVFLDDCFIQYDDVRLRNILKYLGAVSEKRQVILFTCRTNELRCLDELGIDYREIEL